MAVKSLGQLTLDLVTRTGGWMKGMDAAERRSKRWRRQVSQDLKKVGKGFAVAATAAAGSLTVLTKQGLDFVDSQAKTAARLGSTIDDLRALQIAASDYGIEQNQLERSLASYTKRLGDAARGTGEAREAYEALGIEARELAQMPLADQLALVAERIAEVDSAAERTSIADRLMSGGRRMVNLFEEGGGAIRAAVQEVDEFGLSLSAVEAAQVEKANDALGRMPRLLEPIKTQLAVTLADPLTDIADRFNDAARESNGFAAEVVEGVASATEVVAKLLEQINGVREAYLRVRELELNFQAALEAGQNFVTGNESTPAMDALEDVRESLAAIDSGASGLQQMAQWGHETAQQMRENFEARQRERDAIDGVATSNESAAGAIDGLTSSADDAAAALEDFNPSMNDEVQDILDRAGDGATIDAKGQIRDAWGNTLPTLQRELDAEMQRQIDDFQNQANLKAGLDAAAQAFIDVAVPAAQAAWSSIKPAGADELAGAAAGTASGSDLVMPTGNQDSAPDRWPSATPGTGIAKVNQSAAQVGGGGTTGGGKPLGVLTLKGDNGGEIDVQANADALRRWLDDELGGAAASISPT